MVAFRIAAQTSCLAQPFRKALHTLAPLGCDGIQIDARGELRPADLSDTGLRQLRKMLDETNLRVGSVAFLTRRGLSSTEDLDRRVQATIEAVRFASRLGARTLVCTLGDLPAEQAAPARATLDNVLNTLAAHAERCGVRLAAQTGAIHPRVLADYFATLPTGTLALDLHPADLLAHGVGPAEYVELLGEHIAHVHAVDAVPSRAGHGSTEVELGRGLADFPNLLGRLEGRGYRDWVTIERRHSSDPAQDIANAVQYLRSL